MPKPLTTRQHTVLEAIRTCIRERGYPPTIRELGRQLGIKSLRGVTTHLDAIARKGFLKREPRARSISLLDVMAPFQQALRVPIVGRIRTGVPVLTQEHVEGHLVVDGAWVGAASPSTTPEYFAFKACGARMVNAGIMDGDYVIVRQQVSAEHRDIVVALLGEEATIQRVIKDGEQMQLCPEHPTLSPIPVTSASSVTILGKVVAVLRRL